MARKIKHRKKAELRRENVILIRVTDKSLEFMDAMVADLKANGNKRASRSLVGQICIEKVMQYVEGMGVAPKKPKETEDVDIGL